jgi:hypothetical protein
MTKVDQRVFFSRTPGESPLMNSTPAEDAQGEQAVAGKRDQA